MTDGMIGGTANTEHSVTGSRKCSQVFDLQGFIAYVPLLQWPNREHGAFCRNTQFKRKGKIS